MIYTIRRKISRKKNLVIEKIFHLTLLQRSSLFVEFIFIFAFAPAEQPVCRKNISFNLAPKEQPICRKFSSMSLPRRGNLFIESTPKKNQSAVGATCNDLLRMIAINSPPPPEVNFSFELCPTLHPRASSDAVYTQTCPGGATCL